MRFIAFLLLASPAFAAEPDWTKINAETLKHFQALIQIDTSDPPGVELPAAEYIRKVLEAEGIQTKVVSLDPKRPNVIARLKGNGSKRPLLIMGHTDTVNVDPAKWKHGPFSAAREGGYIYGRGTLDDKDNVVAALMSILLLKRSNVPLARDVIFLAESAEEGVTKPGIEYVVNNHWSEIDAEYCLAEAGSVERKNGKISRMLVATAEKIPARARLIASGNAGHGSVPLPDNAIARLSAAVAKAAAWRSPMLLNDTTRTYFERLATISSPADAARYNNLVNPQRSAEIQEFLRKNEPRHYSMLRTSISPTIFQSGYRNNVIPAQAEATLDIRALPNENLEAFFAALKKEIGDDSVRIVRDPLSRPPSPPSRTDTEMFRILESLQKKIYPGAATMPQMQTGATDMAFLRLKGMQCYGIGPLVDEEDQHKGFGAHSDQERILEDELYRFTRFHYEAALEAARQ